MNICIVRFEQHQFDQSTNRSPPLDGDTETRRTIVSGNGATANNQKDDTRVRTTEQAAAPMARTPPERRCGDGTKLGEPNAQRMGKPYSLGGTRRTEEGQPECTGRHTLSTGSALLETNGVPSRARMATRMHRNTNHSGQPDSHD